MDRIISLLAALVGLIALGGAILVHVNGDVQRKELAAEIAALRTSVGTAPLTSSIAAVSSASAEPPSEMVPAATSSQAPLDPQAAQIEQLQQRIAELEQQNRDQASQLAAAKLAPEQSASEAPMSESPPASSSTSSAAPDSAAPAAAASSSGEASTSASSAAPVSASAAAGSGPVSDCIPAGTRFVGKPGDSFAICKTTVTIKVVTVSDGVAMIEGAGPIAAGSFADLAGKGCSVMVFSADATGFADLRVSCP